MFNPFKRQSKVKKLSLEVQRLQHTCNILIAGQQETAASEGNPYPCYDSAVAELSRKYCGTAKWGSFTARNVVDIRAAFTIGDGVTVSAKSGKKADNELAWLAEFMDYNNLDCELPQDWAREAEIEGKFLCRLFPNPETKRIEVRFISYAQHNYKVHSKVDDYAVYEKVTYRVGRTGQEVTLNPNEFVYLRFGGRTHLVNETLPKVGSVLQPMESLHKALVDWRKVNNLFAAPTPFFETEDVVTADALYDKIVALNWKIGRFLVANAKFSMVGLPSTGVDSLKAEITTAAQIISGTTGVPVHFLGFPELMSNRNTADTLIDLIVASTSRERQVWAGGYQEIFEKALAMASREFKVGFQVGVIDTDIPQITSAKLKELAEVWLPLYEAGGLSLETFLSKIPQINAQEELKRLQKQQEEATAKALEQFKAMPPEMQQQDNPPKAGAKEAA